jgi:hypothetical protein
MKISIHNNILANTNVDKAEYPGSFLILHQSGSQPES